MPQPRRTSEKKSASVGGSARNGGVILGCWQFPIVGSEFSRSTSAVMWSQLPHHIASSACPFMWLCNFIHPPTAVPSGGSGQRKAAIQWRSWRYPHRNPDQDHSVPRGNRRRARSRRFCFSMQDHVKFVTAQGCSCADQSPKIYSDWKPRELAELQTHAPSAGTQDFC